MTSVAAAVAAIIEGIRALMSWFKKRPIEMIAERKKKLEELRKKFKKQ